MIAILQHFLPDINLELEGLQAVGKELRIAGPAPPGPLQTPMRSLPASLEGVYLQRGMSMSNQFDGISERSHSPESDMEKDNEADVVDDLQMTDMDVPESHESTSPEIRMLN